MATTKFNISNNIVDNASFALLRTNPKFTSNIKLVVDSNEDLFLSSFKANKSLSKIQYQKFDIKSSGTYSNDVSRFYNNLPLSERYFTLRRLSDLTAYAEYSKQFEDQYNYGASFNSTKLYDEQYKLLAPIWLDKKLPSNFIIYRIKDVDYSTQYSEDIKGQNNRILELLKNSTIIKNYDLKRGSNLGDYLHNHVYSSGFPVAPISFNFDSNNTASYNGIDTINGGFVSKNVNITKDYLTVDQPEIIANEYLTSGFEKNGIISANLINLEFLFDDTTADDYNIYRYFGLYVDEIEEGSFDIDKINNDGLIYIRPDSYKTHYNLDDTPLTDEDMLPISDDLKIPTLNYIKDKSGRFHHIKNDTNFGNLRLPTSSKNSLEELTGYASTGNIVEALPKKPSTKGFLKITIKDTPSPNDRVFIADKTELKISKYNLGDYTILADTTLSVGVGVKGRFSPHGTVSQIAIALANSIKLGEVITYKTTVINNSIIIEDNSSGYNRRRTAFGIFKTNLIDFIEVEAGNLDHIGLSESLLISSEVELDSSSACIQLTPNVNVYYSGILGVGKKLYTNPEMTHQFSGSNDWYKLNDGYNEYVAKIDNAEIIVHTICPGTQEIDTSNAFFDASFDDWSIFTPVGGAKEGAAFMVNKNELGDIKIGQWLKVRKLNQYSQIKEIIQDPYNINNFRVIVNKPINASNDNLIEVYELHKMKHGKFSAYNLKDFNFDFYDTSNSNLGDLSYEINNTQLETIEPTDYFSGLTPILNADNIDGDITSEYIQSEYDRLDENNLKETAVRSRVLPTIMKFALKNATNARNLPYILNVNEAFGSDNLSPNTTITSGRNPEYLNMEHFHINKIPSYFYTENTLTGLDSYTSFQGGDTNGITLDQLKSKDVDYFTLYFSRNGNLNNQGDIWIDDSSKKLYSVFSGGNNVLNPSNVFRGLRYIYKKRKEYSKQIPTEFINSTEVNDYRFGVTFDYKFGESNLVTYDVIKNDIHKFICVVITLTVIEDTKDIDIDRHACYVLDDILEKTTNPEDDIIEDTNIPFLIRLGYDSNDTPIEWDPEGENILYAAAASFNSGENPPKFTDYIKPNNEGVYSWIIFQTPTGNYGMKVVNIIDDTKIIVDGLPKAFLQDFSGLANGVAPLEDLRSAPLNTDYSYWQGGAGGYTNMFNEIVAYNYIDRFNKLGNINYLTIDETGEYQNRFVLEVEDGTEIIKASLTTRKSDGDRPKSYQLSSDEIGKVITLRDDGGYFTKLRRMNGDYVPLFRDVVTFGDIFSKQKLIIPSKDNVELNEVTFNDERAYLIYNKFNNLGISFESYKLIGNESTDYGFLKNVFYHKVNDENVKNLLKLSQTSDKLPLYPAIGEIAIDKKDLNVFRSKYSPIYFTKNLPASRSVEAHGTLSPVEVKSFMASTVMKVNDIYELTSFTSFNEASLESLDYIRINLLNKASIHWSETDSQILADFYLPTSIMDELLEDGIRNVFKNYVKAENSFGEKDSIDDDLEQYVYNNIVNRFIIDQIELYGIEGKNIGTEFISVTTPDDLLTDSYVSLTNYEIQKYQNDRLSFRLIYNKKIGYQYKLKAYVKIQA